MQKLFPNARIDITDALLANADSEAPSEPPRALVDKFSRIPHGKSAADVTRVGFEYQIGSQWGDQYFLSVEIGSGQVVGGMVIQGTAVANPFAGIEGIYDCAAFKTIVVITATKDPNVVEIRGSRIKIDPNTLVYEMRRSSSPMVWNGVLPPHLGGLLARWEFEAGMNAFTSTTRGKPPRRYVKRPETGGVRVFDPFAKCVIS